MNGGKPPLSHMPSESCTGTPTSDDGRNECWEQGSVWERRVSYKRKLENLCKFVQIVSVNTHKPIACVQRDYCGSFRRTKEAFAITCFGTTATDLVMCNLQPAGRMSSAEIKSAFSPVRMDNLFIFSHYLTS